MNLLEKMLLNLFTLVHLKPLQLFFFIRRRLLPAARVGEVKKAGKGSSSLCLKFCPPVSISNVINIDQNCIEVSFLNRNRTFREIDQIWVKADTSRLWQYNLHYFDYLRQSLSDEDKVSLIQSWVNFNPQNSLPGWEPFTASLRIVNWIIFLSNAKDDIEDRGGIEASLYQQVCWLEKNDERHILANHYFENLKALLFAGTFFQGEKADRWRERSVREIAQQLHEQNFPDGGHYERSPQYHSLMLENYLDIYNLVKNNATLFDETFIQLIQSYSMSSLAWLCEIVLPDNKIPLFGDSAFSIAPSLYDLQNYARRLNIASEPLCNTRLVNKPASGIYGVRHNHDSFLLTAGEPSPVYQPGHSHCDILSYELLIGGRRLVVDAGVYEYSPGKMRDFVRSTRAHNTVNVVGYEQSEIWAEFRVARRAKVTSASIGQDGDEIHIDAAFRGFFAKNRLQGARLKHKRKVSVKLSKDALESVSVLDKIEGKGQFAIESNIHFHPDIEIFDEGSGRVNLLLDSEHIATLLVDEQCSYRIGDSVYCPEFGLKYNNKMISICREETLPTELGYHILQN